MNANGISMFVKRIPAVMSKHSPEILTGIGIGGMIATTVMAVKVTPKASRICENLRQEHATNGDDKPTKTEYIKATWKCYIPVVITGLTSIACLIGASSVNARRNAAIAAAYNLSKTALDEYREKVVETLGEKKDQDIKNQIAQDKLNKNPVGSNEVIITKKGDTLCYDAICGRYFKSDIDSIKKAINNINRGIVPYMYMSLNDFYYELGLEPIKIGDDIGWNMDDGQIDVDFGSHLAEDGTPCLVIDFTVAPRYNFSKVF